MPLITGTAGNDRLRGKAANDTINGLEGDDWLDGGSGDDQIFGGAGFDILMGMGGNDMLFGGAGGDVLFGGVGNDTLHGDNGFGQGRGDLNGDRLDGGVGDDLLVIGEGLDTVTGGAGNDSFLFKFNNPQTPLAAGTGPAFATIVDFDPDKDTLMFDAVGVGMDANGANFIDGSGGGGQPLTFFSGAAAMTNGEAVMVLTDQAFASGLLAVQAAQGEDAGDLILYFNSTVGVASLLVVSAPNTIVSIARFTNITSVEELAAANFTADDFMFV
jgi:Ca2+-binding RTX toxin-like protein